MRRHLALLLIGGLVGFSPVAADQSPATWANSLRLRPATLVMDLPAVTTAVSDQHISGATGLLVLTPDRGVFYRYGAFSDRAADQVLLKVRAAEARNAVGNNLIADRPELVWLRRGAAVTIIEAKVKNGDVDVWLWDEFARTRGTISRLKDDPSSGFTISWPTALSKTFTERAEVEALLARVLTLTPDAP